MASEQPNVLLICTDHQSDLMTRPGGNSVVMTPTLSQLARCGTRYSRAYSACPSCIPARRSLMTGMTARAHGDRVYTNGLALPDVPTMPQCFRDAGYQAGCVGKLHMSPQRNRIGFDEVILEEQGRHQYHEAPDGDADDWEMYLAEQGYAGQEFAGGMSTNDFISRPWQLPEHTHQINWASREMCRMIRRRDPRKPGFWYLSFSQPHPPMFPAQAYMDMYRDKDIDLPVVGEWSKNFDDLPWDMKQRTYPSALHGATEAEIRHARLSYYATITQIDHQIRVVLGYLREAELLDNTIVVFTSDHGHMVGEHQMWCMTPFYEMSSKIPLIIMPAKGDDRLAQGHVDNRFAEFGDIMPTLLDLAGIAIPEHVNQLSLVGERQRDFIYGEHGEGQYAQRMIRAGRYKLIYYPVGHYTQLFDIENDPRETRDLSDDPAHAAELQKLKDMLVEGATGNDADWIQDNQLVGLPDIPFDPPDGRHLQGQRGWRFM